MNILIAPNAFKNSLPANLVAEAIEKGLQQSRLSFDCIKFPIGDGGDGTGQLLIQHFNGRIINSIAQDPLGRKITTSFGLIDKDQTAVIELADTSGLKLLKAEEYDPLLTSTYGTGELIKAALDKNAKKIILCIGGSATVDGGTGILRALGIKFLDEQDNELLNVSSSGTRLKDINTTGLDKRLSQSECIILSDVENYLLGTEGAANVFGPQKGASDNDIRSLESFLNRLRDIVFNKTGKDMGKLKYGGAAGGVPAGLEALINARPVNGIEFFLDSTDFDSALAKADLVITGEGSIDLQTLQGKGPYGIALRAKKRNIPVIAFAGNSSSKDSEQLKQYFDHIISINPPDTTELKIALKNTYDNLVRNAKSFSEKIKTIINR